MKFNFDWNCVSSGAPYISINETGLALNTPAIDLLNCPENVIVGFDEANMTIGLMDARNNSKVKSYKFKSRIRNGWVRIGCKDFVKYLSELSGIDFSSARKFVARYDSSSGLLYVTVNKQSVKEEDKSND